MRYARYVAVSLVLATAALADAGIGNEGPGELGAPGMPGGPGGEGPATATGGAICDVLVLPFANRDGAKDLDFWRQPLAVFFAVQPQASYRVHTLEVAPRALEQFQIGRRESDELSDQQYALEEAGGDMLLVGSFERQGELWKLNGKLYETNPLATVVFGEADVSHANPYAAVQLLEQALRAKLQPRASLGGAPGSGPGSMPPAGPGMAPGGPGLGGSSAMMPPPGPGSLPGSGAMPGGPTMPGSGAFPGGPGGQTPGNEGGFGEMPGGEGAAGGMAGGATVTVLDVEELARGIDAWPYGEPSQAFRGDVTAALAHLRRQLEVEPRLALAHHRAALAEIASGDTDRGLALQRAWTEAQDDNAADRIALARVLQAAGRVDEALAAYEAAADDEEAKPYDVPLRRAEILLARGRRDAAMEVITKAIEELPGVAEYQLVLGDLELARGNVKEALAAYKKAAELLPGNLATYRRMVEAQTTWGDGATALKTAIAATNELAPDWRAWVLLTDVQLLAGRNDDALASAGEAIQRAPDRGAPHAARGRALMARGDYDAAAVEFAAAIQADPLDNAPRRQMATAYLMADRLDQAADTMRQALAEATPEAMPQTCRDAARLAFYRGVPDEGHEALDLAAQYGAPTAEDHLLRSFLLLYQDSEEQAWESFNAALKSGLNAVLTSEALRVYQGATAERPPKLSAHVVLGVLYEREQRLDDARTEYRTYRAKAGRGFLADFANERLEATQTRR